MNKLLKKIGFGIIAVVGIAAVIGLTTPFANAEVNPSFWTRIAGNIIRTNPTVLSLQVPGTPGGAGCLQIDGTGNITSSGAGCTALASGINIGVPVGSSTANSVLTVDGSNNLDETTPSVANTFLKWNGSAFVWTTSPTTIAIGSTITGSTPTEVLYTGTLGDLVSDANFTRDEANNFLTRIYSSAIAGTAYTLIDGATAYESGYNDGSRISSVFLANATKTSAKFTNNLIVSSFEGNGTSATTKYDDGAGITSALILDAGKTDLRWATGAGKNAYVGYDDGTGFLTMRMDSPSDDIENYIRITPAAVTLRYDNTNPATASGIVSVEDLSSYLTWNDGMGLVGTVTADASGLVSEWTNGSTINGNVSLLATSAAMTWGDTNTAQFYGDNDTTYNSFTTPFQIYTDEAVTYNPGDVLTSTSGGTGTVVSDDGNGLVILSGTLGAFNAGDTVDDGLGNIASLNANGGIYLALHGSGQNITPTATRYAMFLQTVSPAGVNARYEIADPSHVNFNTPSLTSSNALINFTKNQNTLSTHTFTNTDGGASAGIQTIYYNGASQFMVGLIGTGNTFGGVFTPSTVRFDNTAGNIAYIAGNSSKSHIFNVGGFALSNQIENITAAGVGISGSSSVKIASPTAYLELAAGTATASTAPLKFNSGTLLGTPEVGAVEFLTDKWYGTITTGGARKEFTLNDSALTPGTIPVATTNGRLTDSSFSATTLISGTFTPTPTGVTNITSVTANGGNYTRVGNQVTGMFLIIVDPTTTLTFTEYRVALPVASNFSASNQAAGTCVSGTANESEQILSDLTNDEFLVWATPTNVTSQTYSCSYSYTVI